MKAHRVKDAALAVVSLLFFIPTLIYGFPFLIGANNSYTVMSGSMSPVLHPGDLVIVKNTETSTIKIGDVVTVKPGEFTYTHRVVEKLEGDRFRLKGDANENLDPVLIEGSQIIGKVILILPFSHLYTPYGFILALLAPAALIIGTQAHTVYQFTKRRNKRETMRWRRKNKSALDTGTLLLALILTVSTTRIIAPYFIGGSISYFSDIEWSGGIFRAGTWVTAKWIKQESLVELEAAKTGEKGIDDKIGKAIDHIEKSLDSELWLDENHLNYTKKGKKMKGTKVFDEEKRAVKELMHLIDDPDTPQSVKDVCESVIVKLIDADKMLANTVYDEAKDYVGSNEKVDKELDKCEDEFDKAQEELDKKKYDRAIDHYKHAWEHAQEALKHASEG